jgi:hypothetical protein
VPRGQCDGFLRPYSQLSRTEPLIFLTRSSSIVLTTMSGRVSNPLLLRKSGSAGNRTRASGSVAKNSDHAINIFKYLDCIKFLLIKRCDLRLRQLVQFARRWSQESNLCSLSPMFSEFFLKKIPRQLLNFFTAANSLCLHSSRCQGERYRTQGDKQRRN